MRTLIGGILGCLIGLLLGYQAAGAYAEKLAGQLRACEAQLDKGGR